PKKKDENMEIEEIKAQLAPLSPIIANFTWVVGSREIVMLDFGFLAPSYSKPYSLEGTQVARIFMSWEAIEQLSDRLNEALSEYKKENKRRRTKSSRKSET
ncbi:DUF3467 domain-containing protein, partial [Chloroflexota bacterium]